jgi:hypothetical protein
MAHPEFSRIRLQIIECAIEGGLLYGGHRSPPGSPKMSRLLAMPELNKYTKADPWTFEPNTNKIYVRIRRRSDKTEEIIHFSELRYNHVANVAQKRLELINEVNSRYEIMYDKYSDWEDAFVGRRQLRPIHYVVFTERWDWHGRLYTRRFGHQSLYKFERNTIKFNGCPSVELDYSGMHTRLLYHLRDMDYRGDPYALWGKKTTKPQRQLAKTLINIALNAPTRKAAISQCNLEMSTWTKKKDVNGRRMRKSHKALKDAICLREAYKESGLTFSEIYDLAIEHHKPIVKHFGSDAGIWLMNADKDVAINIMYELAEQAIPCLCCHDSFIVPKHHKQLLRELMNKWYYHPDCL